MHALGVLAGGTGLGSRAEDTRGEAALGQQGARVARGARRGTSGEAGVFIKMCITFTLKATMGSSACGRTVGNHVITGMSLARFQP